MIFASFLSMIPWGCTQYCTVHSCESGARFGSGWFRMMVFNWIAGSGSGYVFRMRIRIRIQVTKSILIKMQLESSSYKFFFHLFKYFYHEKNTYLFYSSRLNNNYTNIKVNFKFIFEKCGILNLGIRSWIQIQTFWKCIRIRFLYKENPERKYK